MNFKRRVRDQKGFTLIEIVIAILILVIITTMTAFNIRRSVKVKARVEQDMDDYSAVRDSLIIITKDVNTAFHYIDITEQMENRINADNVAAGKPPPFPSPPQSNNSNITTDMLTGFDGQPDKLYLTTLSHVRTIQDSPESDQAKVAYYLKDVKSIHDGETTKALIRREATFLNGDDIEKDGRETVLLEHVDKLKFRYLGGDDKQWVDTWKSMSNQDDKIKNHFPDAVEITISTNHDGRKVDLSTVAAVHMTNNDFLAAATSPTPGQPGGNGGAFGAGGGFNGLPPGGAQQGAPVQPPGL